MKSCSICSILVLALAGCNDGQTTPPNSNGPVRVLNVAGKNTSRTYSIQSLNFAADGKSLFVSDNGGGYVERHQWKTILPTITAWDTLTWQQIRASNSVQAKPNINIGEAVSPDLNKLAKSDFQALGVRLLNRKTGKTIHLLKPFVEEVYAFSPDDRLLVGGNGDTWSGGHHTDVWEIETGKLKHQVGYSCSVAFSPDSKMLAQGEWKYGKVRVWDTATWKLLHGLKSESKTNNEHNITAVQFSPNAKLLATVDNDKTVRLWNLKTGQSIRSFTAKQPIIAFSPDGEVLAVATEETVQLWQVNL